MIRIKTSEHNEQSTFIDEVLYQYRNDPTFSRPLFFSVPNGAYLGGKSPATFARLKKEGFRNGVSDILYLQPRGAYAYLALELKTIERRGQKNGGLSDDQREFIETARSVGALAVVCYGSTEAFEAFNQYMQLEVRK
jgi:hypothetical protein